MRHFDMGRGRKPKIKLDLEVNGKQQVVSKKERKNHKENSEREERGVRVNEKKQAPPPPEPSVKFKRVTAICNKCDSPIILLFVHSPLECGGTCCRSCGTFDNFRITYSDNGEAYSFATVYSIDEIKCFFIAKYNDSTKIQNYFNQNKFRLTEINNILVLSGLGHDMKYQDNFFVENKDKQIKFEKKSANNFLEFLNG